MKKVFVIAEAGVNHDGSLRKALKLVEVAARAGADAVKFQTFRAESLLTKEAPKAGYQLRTDGRKRSQYEMIRSLQLSDRDHAEIRRACLKRGIEFMSTPFDEQSLEFLVSLGVRRIKIPSGEITNGSLLLAAARTRKPVILSTGMSTLDDVRRALGVLSHGMLRKSGLPRIDKSDVWSATMAKCLSGRIVLLHCVSQYPAPAKDVNLLAMKTLSAAFGLPVGFSDHTLGTHCAVAAVAMGARVIEKHFTLDKRSDGPDHRASLEPEELSLMVRQIREVEQAMGDGIKRPTISERANIRVIRRSLVAARPIRKGEFFTERNVTAKRPGGGISPLFIWDLAGRVSRRDFRPDQRVSL